jgi:hypothetical protein
MSYLNFRIPVIEKISIMVKLFKKSADMFQKKGFYGVIDAAYRVYLRPYLPDTNLRYNSVVVPGGKLLDEIMPFTEGSRPYYESAIVKHLRNVVQPTDRVLIVGGGWGVTAVIAARQLDRDGEVIVYEASKKYYEIIKQTVKINDVHSTVKFNHSIVGHKVKLKSREENANTIEPQNLPNCNVIELDCEGSEGYIIDNMNIRPRNIIVETHGHRNSPTQSISQKVKNKKYRVLGSEVASIDRFEHCKENDIKVLAAQRL